MEMKKMDSKGEFAGQIFAENEKYILRFLQESDKENYMRTEMENSTIPKAYDLEGYADFSWSCVPEENSLVFCIIEKETGAYCGYCNLQDIHKSTPKIGINIAKESQGKGIAVQVLPLMMHTYAAGNSVEHFVAKVRSDNTHSRHLMEKLGAVQTGQEDSEFKQAMDALKKSSPKTYASLEEKRGGIEFGEDYIVVYRL